MYEEGEEKKKAELLLVYMMTIQGTVEEEHRHHSHFSSKVPHTLSTYLPISNTDTDLFSYSFSFISACVGRGFI